MGYSINCVDSDIFIPAKDVYSALIALNEGVMPKFYPYPLYSQTSAGRWGFKLDSQKNVVEIWFEGEKGRDDDELKPLAPYVKNGSYVEMMGEDGARWRWIFKNGKIITKNAKISW